MKSNMENNICEYHISDESKKLLISFFNNVLRNCKYVTLYSMSYDDIEEYEKLGLYDGDLGLETMKFEGNSKYCTIELGFIKPLGELMR